MIRPAGIGAAVVLGLILVALGRCSVPGLDPELVARADSLAQTKAEFEYERLRYLSVSDSLVALARDRDSAAHAAHAEADRLRTVGARQRARADRLGVALASAQTAADSIPILVQENRLLSVALDSTEAAADSFRAEVGRSRDDVRRLILAVDGLRDQVRLDSVRLGIQEGVIAQLRKAHSGCRVPLIKIKCPVAGPGYGASLSDRRIQRGFTLSVVYPLIGGN